MLVILLSAVLAFYQPQGNQVWLAAWIDTANVNNTIDGRIVTTLGDRPSSINQRIGFNLSAFQYGQNLPVNYSNNEFPFPLEQIDATNTNAAVFLTIYPFRSQARAWDISDADIETLGQQIRNMTTRPFNPVQVLLRFGPEMNGNWMVYGMQPLKYVALWRRVHAIIKRYQPETTFIWSPNYSLGYPYGSQSRRIFTGMLEDDEFQALDTNRNGRFDDGDDPYTPYYPGDQYVDMVGLSFYHKNLANLPPGPNDWEDHINSGNFYQLFAVQRNKLFSVSETAAAYFIGAGGDELAVKQGYWRQGITNPRFLDRYPLVKVISMFEFRKVEDHDMYGNLGPLTDFLITEKPQILNAFVQDFQAIKSRYTEATYIAPAPGSTGSRREQEGSGVVGKNSADKKSIDILYLIFLLFF